MPNTKRTIPPELKQLGTLVSAARARQRLSQEQLAAAAAMDRTRISRIEQGEWLPTLPQLIRLARALGVSLQWFFTGFNAPDIESPSFAIELNSLGIVDLFVPEAPVPGAFRPAEQILVLALRGSQPEPRIVEALPAVLAWNTFYLPLLLAFSERYDPRVLRRLGWLADVTLTIQRAHGFPGGCRDSILLESLVVECARSLPTNPDDLGRPSLDATLHPVWKRWGITYAADLATFRNRAENLHRAREQLPMRSEPSS